MNTKLKQELLNLAHLLHQAIITDDDRVAEAALADLIDSVASMKKVKVEGEGEHRNSFYEIAPGVTLVRFAGKETITLMAKRPANNSGLAPAIFKVFVDKVRKIGCVCCDDKTLFQIVGRECQSTTKLERVCIGALHIILKHRRKNTLKGYRRRKAKKLAN